MFDRATISDEGTMMPQQPFYSSRWEYYFILVNTISINLYGHQKGLKKLGDSLLWRGD